MQIIQGLIDEIDELGLSEGRVWYVPTPEEIAAECKIIQAGWSDAERERRRAIAGRIDFDPGHVFRSHYSADSAHGIG